MTNTARAPSGPKIVVAATLEQYRSVLQSAAGPIPVIGDWPGPCPGFPDDVDWLSYASWRMRVSDDVLGPPSSAKEFDPQRLCVAVASDECVACAELLTTRTGRQLRTVLSSEEFESFAARLPRGLKSLTWVCPGWDPSSLRVTPHWIRKIVSVMRRLEDGVVNWGIVTGVDAAALSRMVAKSLLSREIMETYRTRPSLLFSLFDPPLTESPVAPLKLPATPGRLLAYDDRGVELGGATASDVKAALGERWSLAAFKVHGRSYCAARGFLCGARDASESIEAPPRSCVLGMDCASTEWPQVDPQRYDVPIMVLDACGSGHLETRIWDTNVPALAYKAAAGTPSAVITGDGLTENALGDFVDILWALTSASTVGEATRRLNAVRRDADRAMQQHYFLIGDPEIEVGRERFPSFAESAGLAELRSGCRWQVLLPESGLQDRAPYLELSDLPADEGVPLHLWSDSLDNPIVGARFFRFDAQTSLWFGLRPGASSKSSVFLQVGPPTSLPRGFASEAADMMARTLPWTSFFSKYSTAFLSAAGSAMGAGARLAQAQSEVVLSGPDDLQRLTRTATDEWLAAHRNALQAVVDVADSGIVPYRFWNVAEFTRSDVLGICPYCRLELAREKRYRSFPSAFRRQTECLDCELVNDRPEHDGFPFIDLEVRETLSATDTTRAQVTFDGRSSEVDWLGACAVVMAGRGHAITVEPGVALLNVLSGECITREFTLSRSPSTRVAHRYRVRVAVVLNGIWFLGSRMVLVKK